MSSISLYDAEPQDGSFLGNFKGELNGNGLTIREVTERRCLTHCQEKLKI